MGPARRPDVSGAQGLPVTVMSESAENLVQEGMDVGTATSTHARYQQFVGLCAVADCQCTCFRSEEWHDLRLRQRVVKGRMRVT